MYIPCLFLVVHPQAQTYHFVGLSTLITAKPVVAVFFGGSIALLPGGQAESLRWVVHGFQHFVRSRGIYVDLSRCTAISWFERWTPCFNLLDWELERGKWGLKSLEWVQYPKFLENMMGTSGHGSSETLQDFKDWQPGATPEPMGEWGLLTKGTQGFMK